MDLVLAFVGATAASAFGFDLYRDARRRTRPHIIAYGMGISMFALATWGLFFSLWLGWGPVSYKVFYLFGAVLNVPYLALGSVYLVIGHKTGRAFTGPVMAFSLIALLMVVPAKLRAIGDELIPEAAHTFLVGGPRVLAIMSGAVAGTLLFALALLSAFRFWRKNRSIVWGNLLIAAGTLSAASGGSAFAKWGYSQLFVISLPAAALLIWAGYRVASGERGALLPKAEALKTTSP
jgi:hypothetical protein